MTAVSRALTAAVGVFYAGFGAWAYLLPASFFDRVATFLPYNMHLFHDAGAFQVGLGLALLLPLALRAQLRLPAMAVLIASLLHLGSHVMDIGLGGHPGTDIPFLALICVALVAAIALDLRAKPAESAR